MSSIRPAALVLGLFLASVSASPTCYPLPIIQLSLGNCTVLEPDRTDVHSWGVRIEVEGAGDQCVVPSTVVTSSFLTTEDVCADSQLDDPPNLKMTSAQCRSRRGGFISQAQSILDTSTDGLDATNRNWKLLGNEMKKAAHATLRLGDGAVDMVVGLITGGRNFTASHLGLASGSVFLQSLKDKGLIAARSFGIDVGSQSTDYPRRGSLVLGGYDSGKFASSYTQYLVKSPNNDEDRLIERYCPLQVPLSEIKLIGSSLNSTTGVTKQKEAVILTRSSNTVACIEPYDNLFRLAPETVDKVMTWFNDLTSYTGEPVKPEKYNDKLLNLEPGLVYPRAAGSFNGSMRVTIGKDFTVDVPLHELWRPLRGLDSTGEMILHDGFNELQVYGADARESLYAPVLGKAFLSQVYLFVDHDAQPPFFRLVSQTPETTPSFAVSSASCPGGLSPSDKGLIGVGSVLGAVLIGLLAFVVWRHCRPTKTESQPESDSPSTPDPPESPSPPQPSPSISTRTSISEGNRSPRSGTTTPPSGNGNHQPSGDETHGFVHIT